MLPRVLAGSSVGSIGEGRQRGWVGALRRSASQIVSRGRPTTFIDRPGARMCGCHAVCAVIGTRTDLELRRTFANLDKFDIGFFQNRCVQ